MTVKIQFARPDFALATKWVLDITDVKNDSASIQMKLQKSEAVFSSASLKGERTFSISGSDVSDGEVDIKKSSNIYEIQAKVLRKAVDRLTGDQVIISINDTSITLSSGVDIDVPLLSAVKTKLSSRKNMTKIGTVDARSFFEAVGHLSYLVDTDASQMPRLSCVDFKSDSEGDLTLMATDRYSMSTRTLAVDAPEDADPEAEHRFLIPAADIMSMKCATDSVDISNDDTSVLFEFSNNSTALVYSENDDPMPYERIVSNLANRDDESVFDVRCDELSSLVDTAKIMSETDNNIILTIDPENSVVTVTNKAKTVKGDVPIENVENIDGVQSLLYGYYVLKELLQSTSENTLRVRFIPSEEKANPVVWQQIVNGEVDPTSFFMNAPLRPLSA